jgi:hypothetical protein
MSDFDTALSAYLDHIRADYICWQGRVTPNADPYSVKIRQEMIDRFVSSVNVERGSKYVRVVTNGGAHSFIVVAGTSKFPAGTILKAASWKAPATNFARGNILLGDFGNASWTGAH